MARTKAEIDLMRAGFICGRAEQCTTDEKGCRCDEMAARAFPYPTVTRTRVVTIGQDHYSLVGGHVLYNYRTNAPFNWYTEAQLGVLASLLPADTLRRIADSGNCGPTEEVNVV